MCFHYNEEHWRTWDSDARNQDNRLAAQKEGEAKRGKDEAMEAFCLRFMTRCAAILP